MSLMLYAHPLSSYCQKALMALYENDIPFAYRMLASGDEAVMAELAAHWPLRKFPMLVAGEQPIREASIIIEYLALHYPGPVSLIPAEADLALEVRFMDRFFDNYVSTPQQRVVVDVLRGDGPRDPAGVADAKQMLETAYGWLEGVMRSRTWAAGEQFSMADCAAAPALFYAHWTHSIPAHYKAVHAYRQRLLARPSFARAVEEARPYRHLFPLPIPADEA